MSITNKTIWSVIILSVILIYLYMKFFGCLRNYTEILTKLGFAMQKNVTAFYKREARFPNIKESKVLMEEAGCTNIRIKKFIEEKNKSGEVYERWPSYDCDYNSMKLSYGIRIGDLNVDDSVRPYGFNFRKGETHCFVEFRNDGSVGQGQDFSCLHDGCFNLPGRSH